MIKSTIYAIAKQSKKHRKVCKERKIPIPHPDIPMTPLMYQPEIYIVTKNGKKYIFEILDSQADEPNLIIADIIQSYLVENVAKVFFVAKNNEEADKTKRFSRIIAGRMEDNGYRGKELAEVNVYVVKKCDLNSKKLLQIFKDYAKEDRWD
jgi:hypothetical protein